MMHNYFYHLTDLPQLSPEYTQYAEKSKFHYVSHNNRRYTHQTTSKSLEFTETDFFKKVSTDLSGVNVQYLKSEPFSFLEFHYDMGSLEMEIPRECCINFVLSVNPGAVTMFKKRALNSLTTIVEICDYQLLHPTLFNTQVQHAVFNGSSTPRYVLSISFANTFQEVKEYFTNTKFDHY